MCLKKSKYIRIYSYFALFGFLLHGCADSMYHDDYIKITNEFEKEKSKKKDYLSCSQIEKMYYEYFDSYKVKYNHIVGLASNSDIRELKKLANSKTTCNYVFTGTSSDMLELIKNNTDDYIEKYSLDDCGYINVLNYNHDSLRKYESVLEDVKKNLGVEIDKLIEHAFTNDTMEDLCKMQSLVILVDSFNEKYNRNGENIYGDYNDKDNKIIIHLDPIFKGKDVSEIGELEFFRIAQTLVHEINHMREYICDDRKEKGQINDKITYDAYSDGIPTLLETSAESAIYDEDNSLFPSSFCPRNYDCYVYERTFENELLLLSLTDNSTSLDDYYASMFDTDINGLLSYFNIETDEEIKSFLNILKQQDASLLRNGVVYTINPLKNIFFSILTPSEAKEIMGVNWKVEILRLSLRNLIEYNMKTEEKLSSDEMLALGGLIFFVSCDGAYTTKYEPNDSFINQVSILSNEFFNYVKDEYGISDDLENISSQYTVFEDILTTNPTDYYDTDVATSLTKKFPKLKTIVERVSDNGYSYFEIGKNADECGKSLIYTK